MTLPNERTRAVIDTRRFLAELLDPRATPRIPSGIRRKARRLLKHYPLNIELLLVGRAAPTVFDTQTVIESENK